MLLTTLILAGLYGLVLGSFANVLILRDRKRKTILTGRSECPHCGHELKWYELIPVVSFFIQGGACRSCKAKISWQYPLVELAAAAIVLIIFAVTPTWPVLAQALLAMSFLLALVYAVIDYRTQTVPLDYVVASGVLGAVAQLYAGAPFLSVLYGVATGIVLIQGVRLVWWVIRREEGMGSGDAWIAGALGGALAFPHILVALVLAVFSGAIIGVLLIAQAGSAKKAPIAMPFGPFLLAGAVLALIWAEPLLQWYTGYLGY